MLSEDRSAVPVPDAIPEPVVIVGTRGPQGLPGADGDLPYFASAQSAPAGGDKLSGQKVDGTKGYFTVQQLIEMALNYNAGIKTANAPILNLSQTWNNAAVAFTAMKLNVTDTASITQSFLLDLQVAGASKFKFYKTGQFDLTGNLYGAGLFSQNSVVGVAISNIGPVSWSSSGDAGSGKDLFILRDASNVLAQRNGANAQAFRLYNTYTDTSNYERGFAEWSANVFRLGTGKAGTGVARELHFVVGDAACWKIDVSGHVRPITDGIFDIGSSGLRANHYYGAGNATIGASGAFIIQGRSKFKSSADGVFALYNNAETDFGRLQFGGTTSGFPALKRSSDYLQVRLADDSDYAMLRAKLRTVTNAVAETITCTHTITLYDGSGTPYRVPCAA